MQFYKEQQFNYVQFIPCMDFRSQQIHAPGVYEITPEEYGDFLCEAFDVWYNDGQPVMSIRFFDNLLSVYMRREAELCIHRSACPKTLILEQNGEAFPCDFYFHPDWKLGNIGTDTLDDILTNPIYNEFSKMKPQLPEKCKGCQWLHLCHGGCPRNRRWDKLNQEVFEDYFCASYMQIYAYAHERLRQLGDSQRKEWFERGKKAFYKGNLPGRNEPCACGSGRKYKHCCAE
ncbi:MAG: SPASM domain-containing protein [Paenibacillaceae bacterium]